MTFAPGHAYLARCGESVRVERRLGSRFYGKAFRQQIDMIWNLDGTQFPAGGTGPYDLVRPDHEAEQKNL